MSDNFIIAIDGPAVSGKGTVAKLLAKRFGLITLSTGKIYRAICIYYMDNNIPADDLQTIKSRLPEIHVDVKCREDGNTYVSIDGKDVTDRLEDIPTSHNVANYAKIPEVRQKVKQIQNQLALGTSLVCEGRDITSVVFPDARFKFFLTASLKVRAKRRHAQEIESGKSETYRQTYRAIRERDHMDMTRAISPLKYVKGATKINSTKLNAKQTVDKMVKHIEQQIYRENKAKYAGDLVVPHGGNFFRRFLKLFKPLFHLVFWSRVINKQELKQHRGTPIIIAINHRSNTDAVLFFMTFTHQRYFFPGKPSLFKNKFMNWALRSLVLYPTDNDMTVVRHSLNILKCGERLVIFPEGRRAFNTEDSLGELRDGTAMLSMKSGVPIVPIVLNRKPRPFRMTKFKIGKTIFPANFDDKKALSQKLRSDMAELLNGFEIPPKQKKWDTETVHNVRGVVFIDGKLLVLKREKQGRTYYVFPGGHVDPGETPRFASAREVKEETNVDTEVVRLLYKTRMPYSLDQGNKMQAFYLCHYRGGTVSTTDAEEYTRLPTDPDRHGNPNGTYEPMLMEIDQIKNVELKPCVVRDQLLRDIKKYGTHLTRPTKFIKSK